MNFCSNCVVLGLFWDEKNTFLAVLIDNEVKNTNLKTISWGFSSNLEKKVWGNVRKFEDWGPMI